MTDLHSRGSTKNTKFIRATPEVIYQALTDPAALAIWFAPGDMTGKVHNFDLRVGGGYQMSLFYPSSDISSRGKSSEKEDRYTARFVKLTPPRRIIEAITFASSPCLKLEPKISGLQADFLWQEVQYSGAKRLFINKSRQMIDK